MGKSTNPARERIDSSLSSTSSTTHHHHHGPTPSGSTSRNHKRPTRAVDDEDDEDDDDDDDDSNPLNESLADRVSALKDMIPPRQRARLSTGVTTSARWMRAGFQLGGKTLWVVSTSMLLVVVPWTLACVEEAQMVEMEREMKMQQSANEVCFFFLFNFFLWRGRGVWWLTCVCVHVQVLTPGATSLVGQHLGQGAPVAVTGSGL